MQKLFITAVVGIVTTFSLNMDNIKLQTGVKLNVPFTAQAPGGNWASPYDEACEEASIIMLEYFLRGEGLSIEKANSEILALTSWISNQGYGVDVDAAETAKIAEAYYSRKSKIYYDSEVSIENIKKLLSAGYPIIVPVQGQDLGNPNFRAGGPPYHMLLIVGYEGKNFLTHDPGTRNGSYYAYKQETLLNAIHDWTGHKNKVREGRKAMLILK